MVRKRSDSPARFYRFGADDPPKEGSAQRRFDLKENKMKTLRQRLIEGEDSGIADYHLDALMKALDYERDKLPPDEPA
ncbi:MULTISPECIES: type II toxin-antitoxin system ParD family antitoxin [unclassified Vibrio]|uniref:type II toxin-antitoxin system ParD family antitoxin n=1 Tax=unclassified Vibrio TaxID=2614977 RepID=UPI00354B6CEB